MLAGFPSLELYQTQSRLLDELANPATARVFTGPDAPNGGASKVRGALRLPDARIFYPTWKAPGTPTLYGGYCDGQSALVLNSPTQFLCFEPGRDFPPGSHISPLGFDDSGAYLWATSFLNPGEGYHLNTATGQLTPVTREPVGNRPDLSTSLGRHLKLSATSPDGTKIPIDCYGNLDRPAPTLVSVYGSFGVANRPFYSGALDMLWLRRGYHIALVHSRGGGEFGNKWHTSAQRENRVRARQDLQVSIRELQQSGICTPATTFLYGKSNGVLLVASTAMHSPSLARQVVCRTPISTTKILPNPEAVTTWTDEYGDPRTKDWKKFMELEDPIGLPVKPNTLVGSTWFISGYVDDPVTPIRHADLLARKVRNLGAKLTYHRYETPDSGSHPEPQSVRTEYSYYFWRYLNAQAELSEGASPTNPKQPAT